MEGVLTAYLHAIFRPYKPFSKFPNKDGAQENKESQVGPCLERGNQRELERTATPSSSSSNSFEPEEVEQVTKLRILTFLFPLKNQRTSCLTSSSL